MLDQTAKGECCFTMIKLAKKLAKKRASKNRISKSLLLVVKCLRLESKFSNACVNHNFCIPTQVSKKVFYIACECSFLKTGEKTCFRNASFSKTCVRTLNACF